MQCTLPPTISSQQCASLVASITKLYDQGIITVGVRSLPSVYDRVLIVLFYFRHNLSEQAIAELFRISQPTVSRLVNTLSTHLLALVEPTRPKLEDINPDDDLIIDGTLLPTWDCKAHPENYSGKHHQCGMGIQLACNLYRNLVWVSDTYPGCTHDAQAIKRTGLLAHHSQSGRGRLIGDRGYVGVCHLTPVRKPPGGQLSAEDQAYNKSVNQIRWPVEQKIAHVKQFRCLSTPYRRPLETMQTAVRLIVGLIFFKPHE